MGQNGKKAVRKVLAFVCTIIIIFSCTSAAMVSAAATQTDLALDSCDICASISSEDEQTPPDTFIEQGELIETDQITQYGITFIFDGLYTVGAFANGDFWVKTDSKTGNVGITRITPDYVNDNNRWINGWEVNPVAGTSVGQGFCSEIAGFDPKLVPELPYLAGPGESICKSVRSNVPPRPEQTNRCEQCIQTVSVLTVVDEIPPGNGVLVFRPPYVGTNKPYYYVDNMRTDILPSVEPAGSPPTLQRIAAYYKKVQIDHKGVAMGYDMRPLDSFGNVYGGFVGKRYGEAALRLMLNDPLEDKKEALINFTQMTIDFYHSTRDGRNFGPGGGHQPGHILPLAWFAVMLGDDEAKSYVKNEAVFKTSEHDFLQPSTLDSSKALYGSEKMIFMSFDPYRYWLYVTEDKNPKDMSNLCYPDPYGYIDGGGSLNRNQSAYQYIMSGPWQGVAAAGAIMPELAEMYNNPLLFDYVDRWFTQGQLTQLDPAAPSTGNMDDYGILFGDDPNNPGTPILDPRLAYYNSPTDFGYPEGVQGGRWPERHGNNVGGINPPYYNADFFAPMWEKYYQAPEGPVPVDRVLESITSPSPVKGVPNGTAKTAAALELPSTVTMVTDGGSVQANVNWSVDSCTYDPANKKSQTFTVDGTVTLPAAVANPNNVPLTVSISVTVKKAAVTTDPDKEKDENPDKPAIDDPKDENPDTPPPQDDQTVPILEEEDLITRDYPEMAEQLERLYASADIRDNKLNPTYGAMMKREPVISLTPSCQNRLKQLAKLTFSDIKGTEWYTSHIPTAVYRKLINGFPDGTFRGGSQVTRTEFLTLLARFNNSEGTIKQKAEQDAEGRARIASLMGDSWYTNYIVVSQDGLIYPDLYTSETIVKPMTRGEVFYALANYLWKEDIQQGGKYHTMAVSNEDPAFSDTVKTIYMTNPDAGNDGEKCYCWYKQLVYAAENPENGVPMDFYPAIMCLKDKGILLGNNGESKWYDPISRAEALALFERLAKVWCEESK
jgi:hypothetical protein